MTWKPIRLLRVCALAILLIVVGVFGLSPTLGAQGNFSAQIQLALRNFLAAANTWTGTQTFDDITVTGTCTGCGGGGGTPGGADTQIQFNNAGAFGASSDLIWDGAAVAVGLGGASSAAYTFWSTYPMVFLQEMAGSKIPGFISYVYNSTANLAGGFYPMRSRGTPGSPSAVLDGDNLGVFEPEGYDGLDWVTPASFQFIATDNFATNYGTKAVLKLTSDGTAVVQDKSYEFTGTAATFPGTLSTSARGIASASLPAGTVLQVANSQTGAYATGTTTVPIDDTIPQNTEGTEFMTVTITPQSAASKLKVEVVFFGAVDTAFRNLTVALFQDSTANALASVTDFNASASAMRPISFTHYMTSGTTSATTFKVRAGVETSGTTSINGAAGSRYLGGVAASSITVTEIAQ